MAWPELGAGMRLFSLGAPAEPGLSLFTVGSLMPSLDGVDKNDVRREGVNGNVMSINETRG